MTTPQYVAKGTFTSGTGAIAPPLPTGVRNGDLLVLVVESANQAITTPTGWTQAPNSPQFTGTAAVAGGVRVGVFYKVLYGNLAAPSVADTGDHTAGQVHAFRGVDPITPINASAGSVDSGATTTITVPAVTTTVTNTMIVGCIGLDKDLADVDTITGTWTNANLSSITERHDETVIAGAGGGLAVVTGIKATAGATGTTTNTADTSTTHAYVTLALQGRDPIVRTVGQLRNDGSTVLTTGAASTDGVSNNVTLVTEYSAGDTRTAIIPKSETEAVGTSFDNAANATLKTRIQNMPTADTTSSRRGSSLVYDDVNKRYLSFGGYDGTTRYNDVWEFYTDEPHRAWRKLAPTGTPPTGRNLHGATIVKANLTSGGALRMYMIIWGGADPADKNDMLALRIDTPGSEVWSTITQTSAPSVRSYVGNHLVATPGTDGSNNYIYLYGGWAAVRENQLVRCTFDVDAATAVTWTTLKATGTGGNPPQQTGVVMDYKASTNKLYIYGGYNGTTYYNTFWEYDVAGNTFTNTSPSGTAPTASEVMAGGYDATNNRFWFTGGWTTNGTFTTGLNQIGYISDVGGSEAYVIARANAADNANQGYAGNSFAGCTIDHDKDLLVLRGMATIDSTERYAYAIDLNDGITTDKPAYGISEGEYLTPRDAIGGVWHEDSQEWVMLSSFAHMSDEATIAQGTHVSDIWSYSHTRNTWRYANKGFKTLPPGEGKIACYDTYRDRVLIFGGLTGVAENINEVWTATRDSMGNYSAARLFPTGTPPSDRWLGWIAYDAALNRMITGMGRDETTMYNDTYALTFDSIDQSATATGSQQNIQGGTAGSSETNQAGGQSFTAGATYSTEYIDLPLKRSGIPQDTVTLEILTGSMTGTVVGTSSNTIKGQALTTAFTQQRFYFPAGVSIASGTMYFLRLVRSGARDTTNYYAWGANTGGYSGTGDGYTRDNNSWATVGSVDMAFKIYVPLPNGAWTTLSPSGTPPTAAWQPWFINKKSNSRVYLGGGATNAGATAVSAQMLYFDYSTTNGAWTTPTTSGFTARRGMAFGYDEPNDTVIVSHGFDAGAAISSTQWLNLADTAWVTPTITGHIPPARRSTAGMVINGELLMFGGRPATGMWFNDTSELIPNYQTPNSTIWTDKAPRVFTPAYHNKTGLSNSTGYHWQAWATEASDDSVKVSHG